MEIRTTKKTRKLSSRFHDQPYATRTLQQLLFLLVVHQQYLDR